MSINTVNVAVVAVIAVGFLGLAVCLTIICCGVVCLRRYNGAIVQQLNTFITSNWSSAFSDL